MTGVTIDHIKELHAPFPADMIHWRAQKVVKSTRGDGFGALALAYLDSRNVMDRLDSVIGAENWQAEHYDANGKMACKIGINIDGQWVWKSDGAGDTDIEAEKGAFSSAFKRAAVHWGIGRYLYDLGNTWVPCEAYMAGDKPKFRRFTEDPWKHVRNAQAFLPSQPRKVA